MSAALKLVQGSSLNGRTYMTPKMIATIYGCSESTIRRRMIEMEATGRYPYGLRKVKGTEISREDFDDFVCRGGK